MHHTVVTRFEQRIAESGKGIVIMPQRIHKQGHELIIGAYPPDPGSKTHLVQVSR